MRHDEVDNQTLGRWSDAEAERWDTAFADALDDSIAHLQTLIFEENWDALVEAAGGNEAALRESVRAYEQGLAHLFGFVRACGAPEHPVAWSAMKAARRREALESGVEITLRTALETGLYAAETVPLGDHSLYRSWTGALTLFLAGRASATAPPPPDAPADELLIWAYDILAPLEEHEVFHAEFAAKLRDPAFGAATRTRVAHSATEIIDFQARLMTLRRFDLALNASLLWLASAGKILPWAETPE